MQKIRIVQDQDGYVTKDCPNGMMLSDSAEGRQSISSDSRIIDCKVKVASYWCRHCENYCGLSDINNIKCNFKKQRNEQTS